MDAVAVSVAKIVDGAIARGARFTCEDFATVHVATPRNFAPEDYEALRAVAPQVRLLIKLRVLADWPDRDHEAFLQVDLPFG